MTLIYVLTEDDYLQFHLFNASKSERIKKQRRNSWLILSGSCFLLGVVLFNRTDNFLFYWFLFVGIMTLLFYPIYQRNHYKKHYKKYIADVHKNSFNETITITLTDSLIETLDRTGTSKIFLTELDTISETGSYFYLKLKTGTHLIIPKSHLQNIDELRTLLKLIAKKFNATFISDLNWQWK